MKISGRIPTARDLYWVENEPSSYDHKAFKRDLKQHVNTQLKHLRRREHAALERKESRRKES